MQGKTIIKNKLSELAKIHIGDRYRMDQTEEEITRIELNRQIKQFDYIQGRKLA